MAVRPENEVETVRATVPEKPPREVRVIVELAEPPPFMFRGFGLKEIPKSAAGAGIVTAMVVETVVVLVAPLTVTE